MKFDIDINAEELTDDLYRLEDEMESFDKEIASQLTRKGQIEARAVGILALWGVIASKSIKILEKIWGPENMFIFERVWLALAAVLACISLVLIIIALKSVSLERYKVSKHIEELRKDHVIKKAAYKKEKLLEIYRAWDSNEAKIESKANALVYATRILCIQTALIIIYEIINKLC